MAAAAASAARLRLLPAVLLFDAVASTAAAASAAAPPPPVLAETHLVSPQPSLDGLAPRCLDGSTPRYWVAAGFGDGATKWAVHLQGGGWCESVEGCAERAYDARQCLIGSSSPLCFGPRNATFSERMDLRDVPTCQGARWCGALMVNNQTENPLAWNWNKLYVPYCDGGSFGGRNRTATMTTWSGTLANGTSVVNATLPLYFRGRVNLAAVVAAAKERHGLADATDVVIGGDSAGGLATYWSADWWTEQLPHARVAAAPDSGFFFDWRGSAGPSSATQWEQTLGWVVAQGNSTGSLNEACLKANGASHARCAFPDEALQHITTPLFVMQGRADAVMDDIVGVNKSDASEVAAAAAQLQRSVAAAVAQRPDSAAFLTGCWQHCGQWGTGQEPSAAHPLALADARVVIDGVTGTQAVAQWHAELVNGSRRGRVWVQPGAVPCAVCCGE